MSFFRFKMSTSEHFTSPTASVWIAEMSTQTVKLGALFFVSRPQEENDGWFVVVVVIGSAKNNTSAFPANCIWILMCACGTREEIFIFRSFCVFSKNRAPQFYDIFFVFFSPSIRYFAWWCFCCCFVSFIAKEHSAHVWVLI